MAPKWKMKPKKVGKSLRSDKASEEQAEEERSEPEEFSTVVGTPIRGTSISTVEPVSVVETEPVIEVASPGFEDLEEIAEERKEALEMALKAGTSDDKQLEVLFEAYHEAEEERYKQHKVVESEFSMFRRLCLPKRRRPAQERPEPDDLATNQESYMNAVVLLMDGNHDGFRRITHFEFRVLQQAMCYMFIKGAIRSLCRIAEFLIFLLSEARLRAEEDVERGEALNLLHHQIQQALVVFVEKLRPREQERLWYSREGQKILMQLQLADARLFFARPKIQKYMYDLWRGVRPHNYDRSFLKQLKVWAMLLVASMGNLGLLLVWALVPELERRCSAWVIQTSEEALEEERAEYPPWGTESDKTRKSGALEAAGLWVNGTKYWNEAAYNRAVRDQLRAKIFDVQRLMPLLIPRHKKYLTICTNLLFAFYLAMESPDEAQIATVSIISLGAWVAEVNQLLGFAGEEAQLRRAARYTQSFSFWFMDRVNIMELVAFTSISVGSALCLIDRELTEFAQSFKAVGVLFLSMSQCMAMLRMSSVLGPLVSMCLNMIVDMMQWGLLLLPIIACFVAALITLFKSRTEVGDPNCMRFENSTDDYVLGMLALFETQVGGDPVMTKDCLLEHQHRWPAQVLMNFGLWIVVVLMLNMLIAMMAKTFDRIYEGAMVDFQFSFVGTVIQTADEPAVPPVLRSLSLPYELFSWSVERLTGWSWAIPTQKKFLPTEEKAHVELRESVTKEIREELLEAQKNHEIDLHIDVDDDMTVLSAFVDKFMESHAADAEVQDKIWRRQFARHLLAVDSKVDALLKCMEVHPSQSGKAASSKWLALGEELRKKCQELEHQHGRLKAKLETSY